MTVRINFLPRTYQPPKQLGVKDWAIAAGAAVVVMSTSIFYMSAFATTGKLEKQVQADQVKLQSTKALLTEAAQIKAREERVVKAEAELHALAGRNWSSVLLTLTDLTPQRVTWTGLHVEGSQMTLKATSRGLVDVAQLFGGLLDNQEVTHVALRYVDEKGMAVTVVAAVGDGQSQDQARQYLATFRQMEFEMVITLKPAEGRRHLSGA